jgi:hypothetical protein
MTSSKVEVMVGGRKRRLWTADQKKAIVEESEPHRVQVDVLGVLVPFPSRRDDFLHRPVASDRNQPGFHLAETVRKRALSALTVDAGEKVVPGVNADRKLIHLRLESPIEF